MYPKPHVLITLQAGVTHCFVNLGSDHPSILEAIVKGQTEKRDQFPRIITCPNEVRPQVACLRLCAQDKCANTYQPFRWLPCLWLMAMPG